MRPIAPAQGRGGRGSPPPSSPGPVSVLVVLVPPPVVTRGGGIRHAVRPAPLLVLLPAPQLQRRGLVHGAAVPEKQCAGRRPQQVRRRPRAREGPGCEPLDGVQAVPVQGPQQPPPRRQPRRTVRPVAEEDVAVGVVQEEHVAGGGRERLEVREVRGDGVVLVAAVDVEDVALEAPGGGGVGHEPREGLSGVAAVEGQAARVQAKQPAVADLWGQGDGHREDVQEGREGGP